jgi:DNA-binding beta-propeller fold protein YncE
MFFCGIDARTSSPSRRHASILNGRLLSSGENPSARSLPRVKSNKESCAVWRGLFLYLLSCLPVTAQVAPIPTPTQLPSSPFSIRKNWLIGGTGNWDYLTVDSSAQRLYIAHGHSVQVVDLDSGTVSREIGGFREAHAIALDDIGQYGYISDGPAQAIAVFDRRTLEIASTVSINCSPRSLAFEPSSKLLFAVCGSNVVNPEAQPSVRRQASSPARPQRPPGGSDENNFAGISHVIAVDTEKNTAVADIAVSGDFRFAQADGAGLVYVTVAEAERMEFNNGHTNRYLIPPQIAKFDGPSVATEVQRLREHQSDRDSPVSMDWVGDDGRGERAGFTTLPLPSDCKRPQGLAVDSKDSRLFAACNDQQMLILNATNGHVITTLTTGPGDDVIGYDPDRELIYSANGDGYGSLTVVQQDANTDSYAVIQNLPTLARARTLAIDSSSGEVYLVTDYMGVDLTPRGAFTTIKTTPISGSFQVLVIGR